MRHSWLPSTVGAMPSHTIRVRRGLEEAIESRRILRAYAPLAIAAGIAMVGTGIRGNDRLPLAHESLIWIAGMTLVAFGCAASGLALNDEPIARRRALLRFAIGHVLLGLFLWMQWS